MSACGPNNLITQHQIPVTAVTMHRGSSDSDVAKTHSKLAKESTTKVELDEDRKGVVGSPSEENWEAAPP